MSSTESFGSHVTNFPSIKKLSRRTLKFASTKYALVATRSIFAPSLTCNVST
jgi:alcohol dehydrogenase class IV